MRRSASSREMREVGRAARAQHVGHLRDLGRHFLLRAIGLAEQDRRRVEGIARVHELLDGAGGELIHHLEAGRHDPGRDDARDRLAGAHDIVERGHHHRRLLGLRRELDRDLGDDAEQALGAGHEGEQIVARRIERVRADLEDVALDGRHAQLEDVVHREPVLEAVHAARVLGDVAADGAGDLARRIGGVVEAVLRHRLGDGEIAHARLHAGGARERVDGEDVLRASRARAARPARSAARRRRVRCRRRARPPARRPRSRW